MHRPAGPYVWGTAAIRGEARRGCALLPGRGLRRRGLAPAGWRYPWWSDPGPQPRLQTCWSEDEGGRQKSNVHKSLSFQTLNFLTLFFLLMGVDINICFLYLQWVIFFFYDFILLYVCFGFLVNLTTLHFLQWLFFFVFVFFYLLYLILLYDNVSMWSPLSLPACEKCYINNVALPTKKTFVFFRQRIVSIICWELGFGLGLLCFI